MPPRTRAARTLSQVQRASPEPLAKRQKTVKKAAPPPVTLQATTVTSSGTTNPSTALLPPTLTFSLADAISHLTDVDPRFERFFAHVPCRPFVHLEAIDPFRTLVTSIIGQQVSWMAARAINNRFRALFGYDAESKEGFPTPEDVAKEEVLRLKSVGLSTRKAEYVISLAQHFVSGELSTELLRDGTDDAISKALIAVRGIGQWTVDMFLMFSLRRPDVLAVGDLGVQKGLLKWALAAHGALPQPTPKKAAKRANASSNSNTAEAKVEVDTVIKTPPATPTPAAIRTDMPPTPASPTPRPVGPGDPVFGQGSNPAQVATIPPETMPVASPASAPAPSNMVHPPPDGNFDPHRAAPLTGGLSVETLRSRLAGKKVKGGMYLTPAEMESLAEPWKPYRSLGVFYMWPVAED